MAEEQLVTFFTGPPDRNPLRRNVSKNRYIGGIALEAVISEDHAYEVEVTQHRVEQGIAISDHRNLKPRSLTMVVAFDGIKWKRENELMNILGATDIGGTLMNIGEMAGIIGETKPSSKATGWLAPARWNVLKLAAMDNDFFHVQTGLELYKNMQITKLSASQDVSTENILYVTITLTEMRIVATKTIKTPIEILKAGDTKNRAASKVDRGPVAPKPVQGASGLMHLYGMG